MSAVARRAACNSETLAEVIEPVTPELLSMVNDELVRVQSR